MRQDKLKIRKVFLLLIILILASVFRFWKLGQVPLSMTDDEIREVYSAYSIWHTGKDVYGRLLPFSFNLDGFAYAPVSIYITSIFTGLLGLSMFSARLPFALSGVFSVICLYFISLKFFKNYIAAFLSAVFLSISVWHLQVSRFAHEGGIALLFYCLGLLLFLSVERRNYFRFIAALVLLFLAFYSYSATKVIFIPLIAILVWYKRKELNPGLFLTVATFVFFTIASFGFLSKTQSAAQYTGGQFFFQDLATAAKAVELERRSSTASEFFKRLFHNKLTYWTETFSRQYLYAFSPQYLFTDQEGSGIYSLWFRGQLYLIDLPFLLLGLLFLFRKYQREFLLIVLMLLVAPLPSGLGVLTPTYTMRSIFMLPWLMALIALGVYYALVLIENFKLRKVVIGLIFFAYAYFLGDYLHQYYYEWAIYGSKYYSKDTQDLVLLVNQKKDEKNKIIIGGATSNTLMHYAFYNRISPKLIQQVIRQSPMQIDNVIFKSDCLNGGLGDPKKVLQKNVLYLSRSSCHEGTSGDYQIVSLDKRESFWKAFEN